jgi:hypothetical protein
MSLSLQGLVNRREQGRGIGRALAISALVVVAAIGISAPADAQLVVRQGANVGVGRANLLVEARMVVGYRMRAQAVRPPQIVARLADVDEYELLVEVASNASWQLAVQGPEAQEGGGLSVLDRLGRWQALAAQGEWAAVVLAQQDACNPRVVAIRFRLPSGAPVRVPRLMLLPVNG